MPDQTILIVDDWVTLRHPMRAVLEREGYKVEEACNGHEALQKIAESHPDLVLLDLIMPQMGGAEVLRHVKTDATLQDTPIIVLTAAETIWQMPKYIEMGAADYLLKPFTLPTLLNRVRSILRGDRLAV
jgi:two-component system phosphate regulon response regulator PhoB